CEEDPGAAHQVLCRWPHAGLHEVAVAVLDADGATSFAVERVDVRQPSPAVAFEVVGSPRVGCGTATQVLLRDTSVPDGAPIERWAWDIGADGSVEHTGPELAWTPARAGHHAVRLTVVDAAGFTGTVTRMVPVDGVATPVPMLHRSPAGTIYTGVPLLVWDRSIPGDAPLGPAAWDLGDGALATGPSVTHLYEKPGRYIVQLTVADSFGCVGVATDVVRVEAMEPLAYEPAPARRLQPRIEAPSQVAVGELVRFRDATPTTEGAIVAWQWDIPGTQVPAEPQAQARFAAPGVHAVALTVTDSAGHTATAVHELRVTQAAVPSVAAVPPPVARAGADRLVLPGATVRLDGGDSVSHAGKELLYRWEQVAGPAVQLHGAATQAPSFVAPDAAEGALLVFRLTVADTAGRSQPDDVVLRVQPRNGPAVVAEVDGPVVRLRAEALPGETVEWELGDGKTATGPGVTHTFTRAGRYEVVARAGGHATTTSVEVTLPTRERPALAEEQAAPAARIAGIPAQAVAGAFAATVAVAGGALAVALRRR
ncbi:MAG TPA: PKD domain-containing protein, partial [Candidatus Thermoplasmatota archaeon]|nr:PKD domain-containing protein [Candidatus Thermoplasmatota archaeon]